jgi:hypothetical protein
VPVAFTRACATWTRTGKGRRAGQLAAFANKKYTSNRCLPASWLTECMAGYEGMFGEKVQESMLDMDAVAAELVGRSGLGWVGRGSRG